MATVADGYSRLEEGEYTSPQPQVRRVNEAAWRFVKIAWMSFMTIMGIVMLVSPFVSQFVYHDPTLQDHPYRILVYIFLALLVMGIGYVPAIVEP